MNPEPSRRLAAVWFADIVGYTELSSRDEDRALSLLGVLREASEEAVADRGRIVKFLGDGALAEFSSTEAAVRAALSLQELFSNRSTEGDHPGASLRIGIHVGDIVTDPDGDVHGDGVNTASRLQDAAEPGQILASEAVRGHLQQRRVFAFVDRGERALRGLAGPLRVFEVRLPEAGESGKAVGAARAPSQDEGAPSIAVLPFAHLSGHPEDEYFGDGMTEEIINALCQLGQLRVIARTSSFAFKGQNLDIREIGRTLGVGHVLEGSVRRAGNRIRVTAQLIQVSDGFHLWSQRFDRVLEDVFDIQDEVSLAITDHLKVHLIGTDRARLTKRHTDDVEAYNSYLLGRHLLERFDERSLRQAIEHLEKALAEDPEYAEALAALSHAHFLLGFYSHRVPQEAFAESKELAHQALSLDNGLAEAHSALGVVKAYLDWDWKGSLAEFEQALLLNPNSADAHRWYTYVLIGVGDLERATDVASLALKLNPLSPESMGMMGWCLVRADRHDEARKYLKRLGEFNTALQIVHWLLGQIHLKESRFQEGISEIEEAARLAPDDPLIVSALGWAYAVAGRSGEARQMIERLDLLSENRYVDRYLYAKIFAGLGEIDAAFQHLEEAVSRREMGVAVMLGDETVESLRSDSRFAGILDRIGLTEAMVHSLGGKE